MGGIGVAPMGPALVLRDSEGSERSQLGVRSAHSHAAEEGAVGWRFLAQRGNYKFGSAECLQKKHIREAT